MPQAWGPVLADRRARAVGDRGNTYSDAVSGFAVRGELGARPRVAPGAVSGRIAGLVDRIHRVSWPVGPGRGPRAGRDLTETCRLQAARGLTVLSWLADGHAPDDVTWLLSTRRLGGERQARMYAAAESLPDPVNALVVANWTWVLASTNGGRVVAPYIAGRAHPDDGCAAAENAVILLRTWESRPEARPALAAAWAATRTPVDWCRAAARAAGGPPPLVFTYPRTPLPALPGLRPWIGRLLRYRPGA